MLLFIQMFQYLIFNLFYPFSSVSIVISSIPANELKVEFGVLYHLYFYSGSFISRLTYVSKLAFDHR